METEKKTKKPRLTKRPAQYEPSTYPVYKGDVMLGIDPAFKKCGFGIISMEDGRYIHSFQREMRPYDQKLTQAQVDGFIANNVQQVIDDLFAHFSIKYVVIELQLGQFSADRIQLAFVMALPLNVPFTVQHSKLKLKHKETKDVQADNPESNKYNQNKH